MNSSAASLIMLAVLIAVIYFMMIRPQQKQDKANKEMRAGLTPGDEIVTIGGILGKIVKVKEKTVIITVGAGRTQVEILKTAVSVVTNHAEGSKPAKAEAEHEAKEVNRDKKVTPKKLTAKKEAVKEEEVQEEPAKEETASDAE
jgi:preprotein translocase subunit YajC